MDITSVPTIGRLYADLIADLDDRKRALQSLQGVEFTECPTCEQITAKCPKCGGMVAGTTIMHAVSQGRRELPLSCFRCSARENANG